MVIGGTISVVGGRMRVDTNVGHHNEMLVKESIMWVVVAWTERCKHFKCYIYLESSLESN